MHRLTCKHVHWHTAYCSRNRCMHRRKLTHSTSSLEWFMSKQSREETHTHTCTDTLNATDNHTDWKIGARTEEWHKTVSESGGWRVVFGGWSLKSVLEGVSWLEFESVTGMPTHSWSVRNRRGGNWAQEKGGAATFLRDACGDERGASLLLLLLPLCPRSQAFQTLQGDLKIYFSGTLSLTRWHDHPSELFKINCFCCEGITHRVAFWNPIGRHVVLNIFYIRCFHTEKVKGHREKAGCEFSHGWLINGWFIDVKTFSIMQRCRDIWRL